MRHKYIRTNFDLCVLVFPQISQIDAEPVLFYQFNPIYQRSPCHRQQRQTTFNSPSTQNVYFLWTKTWRIIWTFIIYLQKIDNPFKTKLVMNNNLFAIVKGVPKWIYTIISTERSDKKSLLCLYESTINLF